MNANEPMDIGIDLGTTFSVIAVQGRVETVEGYPDAHYLEAADVSILPTEYGEFIFPSVTWVDPTGKSFKFGAVAKQLASAGESPIMFSKRSIGTTEQLKIHDLQYTAKEVATLFLEHLKSCAEKATGRPVRRAVITHPAYFNENQVQETREAAVAAGFEMSSRKQMLMEPTAAAITYTLEDDRDPLRIMTYDLGGGTFDVTILERRQGVITITAFDGDHLLGGYNFDRAMLQWIIGRVRSTGRKIPYDADSQADNAVRSRLLILAESAKIRLANEPNAQTPVLVRDPDCLKDDQGLPVSISLEITRADYTQLISEYLQRTIDCCRRALATASLNADQLDEILLVGGSTCGPWVSEAVEEAFGLRPRLFEPDLCVAAGAALAAANLPGVSQKGSITLEVDAPQESALPTATASGSLQSDDESVDWSEYQITLEAESSGHSTPIEANPDGRFLLKDLQLDQEQPTSYRLHVADPSGASVVEHGFTINYAPEASTRTIDAVLPKSISVKVAGGMKLIAKKGLSLPTLECTLDLRRVHSDDSIEIPVFQHEEEVGAIRVGNITDDAGAGSAIQLCLRVNEQNELTGVASVFGRTGAVAASCDVQIGFPPIEIPSLAELKSQLNTLDGQRQQQLSLSDDPEIRTLLGGAGDKLVKAGRKRANELQPDRHELYQICCELDQLVNPPIEEMDPPRSQYDHFADACRNIIGTSKDPQITAYDEDYQKINTDANEAYDNKNHRLWTEANRSISRLYDRLKNAMTLGDGPVGPPPEPDPAWVLKDIHTAQIGRLKEDLRARRSALETLPNFKTRLKPRCDELATTIEEMEAAVQAVDDDEAPTSAQRKLSLVYRQEKQVRRAIPLIEYDAQ